VSRMDDIRARLSGRGAGPPPAPPGPAPLPPTGPTVSPLGLRERRTRLARELAELQWDLGGAAYEMAIRDHFRIDVLARRAARLQEVDAELGEVERIARLEDAGAAGECHTCGALHSRGATFCWRCGSEIMASVSPEVVGGPGEGGPVGGETGEGAHHAGAETGGRFRSGHGDAGEDTQVIGPEAEAGAGAESRSSSADAHSTAYGGGPRG